MKLPTLYKLTGRGNLQEWTIEVESMRMAHHKTGTPTEVGVIITRHGQVGGKIQEGRDIVYDGKNEGKANATTPAQQAEAEATAKWTKQKDRKGYLEDRARAEAGESDRGCIAPMLAQTLEDVKAEKLKWPADFQRKLDGVRCLVKKSDGKVQLWSRQGTLLVGIPHIQAAYDEALKDVDDVILDGEIYRHGWKLQKISGFVRKAATKPGFEELKHCIYDLPVGVRCGIDSPWERRRNELQVFYRECLSSFSPLALVETFRVEDHETMVDLFKKFRVEEYEGGIRRDLECPYEADVRSYGLLKVKEWKSAEFPIVGIKEGRGKFAGLAIFECKTVEGRDVGAPQTFDCCAPGDFNDRAWAFKNAADIVGKKQLTVKYFDFTEDKKPAFPTGEAIRDYE